MTISRILMAASAIALASVAACSDDPRPAAERAAVTAEEVPSAEFLALADAHAAQILRVSPELATALGVSEETAGEGYQSRLADYGVDGAQLYRTLNERFRADLSAVEPEALQGVAAITHDVLDYAYEVAAQRNGFEFGGAAVWGSQGPYVVTQLTGVQIALPRLLLTQHPVDAPEDAEAYLARLGEFERVVGEALEQFEADVAAGVRPPRFVLEGAAEVTRAFIEPAPAENPLVAVFDFKMEAAGFEPARRAEYADRARAAVETVVYPAFSRLAAALETEAAQASDDAGLWRLGETGAAFYRHALYAYGAGDMTPDEIHELGLEEVARITAAMNAILAEYGLEEGPISERLAALAERERMYYSNTEDGRRALLASLRNYTAAIIARAPDWFGTLPPQPVEVRRIPEHEQSSAPGGYYTGPSLDGDRPGIFWINLKDTRDWPQYALPTLTYHEAVPGHHFQVALQRDVEDMPIIRNMMGFSEYSEGWALYAERVAAEMGVYEDDPFGELGRLQAELFRSVRLVVDTGLHHKRWSREQAIAYMRENTGRSPASVVREVERYAAMPGQACSYKLGMVRIEAMRAKAEAALGEKFDIRAFHDELLLSGAVPLPILERKIDRWIAARQETGG